MEKMYCNPLNLEYRYQIKNSYSGKQVFREAADPTMVVFKDQYLLFCSMSGGFWYSDDLQNWAFHPTPELPIHHYAPDVREVNGQVVFSASRRGEKCTIYRSPDPLNVPFQPVSTSLEFWDPDIFQDDDGRVYLYWGCDNRNPIFGIELNPETLEPIGQKQAMFGENMAVHGWERSGENNTRPAPKNFRDLAMRLVLGSKPFIEGAFVTKYQGKYYLQYAAPGTEYNVYGDGVYVSDAPLGPWQYQAHNPFSSVPGGFMTGAGHGSTFQDKQGHWWHVSTMRISVNENFERRIGLFPCHFDKDGILYCDQHFATHPQLFARDAEKRTVPALNLISYQAGASASSCQIGFGPELGTDENCRTWWAASEMDDAPWYMLDLGEAKTLEAVQVNFADHQLPFPETKPEEQLPEMVGWRVIRVESQKTEFVLEASLDGEVWQTIKDNRELGEDYPHDFIVLEEPAQVRYLRLRDIKVSMGGVAAVSGLRAFGKGNGKAPGRVEKLFYTRSDRRNLKLRWEAAPGAEGYNVRYGIAPDKLYASWQVIGKTELDLSMINADQNYWIAVDSYNENGVTASHIWRTC